MQFNLTPENWKNLMNNAITVGIGAVAGFYAKDHVEVNPVALTVGLTVLVDYIRKVVGL